MPSPVETDAQVINPPSSSADYLDMEISPTEQMVSSCTGALLVSLFMTPLDVVKIRLQSQDLIQSKKCFLYSNGINDFLCERANGESLPARQTALHTRDELCNCRWYNRPKYFNGTFDAFVKIGQREGLRSLWSGLSPTLVSAVPTTVIYFTTYEQLKTVAYRQGVLSDSPRRDQAIPLASGALARIWACTVVSPLELVRTKMQSKKMSFAEIRDVLVRTVAHEGPLGLMRGYSATLYRDVPFSALYWPCYEYFKRHLVTDQHQVDASFASGAMAGAIASAVTLPMDVIKTRRQIETVEAGSGSPRYPSTLSTAKEIVASQGVRGLFVGLTPRVLKVAPACAIMISSYDYFKRWFVEQKRDSLLTSTMATR